MADDNYTITRSRAWPFFWYHELNAVCGDKCYGFLIYHPSNPKEGIVSLDWFEVLGEIPKSRSKRFLLATKFFLEYAASLVTKDDNVTAKNSNNTTKNKRRPFVAKKLYSYFEDFVRWQGYSRIEALCHEDIIGMALRMGYTTDDRTRNDLDPTLTAIAKYLISKEP